LIVHSGFISALLNLNGVIAMNLDQSPHEDKNYLRIISHPRMHELSRVVDVYPVSQDDRSTALRSISGWGSFFRRTRDIVSYINSRRPLSIKEVEDLGREYIYKC